MAAAKKTGARKPPGHGARKPKALFSGGKNVANLALSANRVKGVALRKDAAKVLSEFGRAARRAEQLGKPFRITIVVKPRQARPQIAIEEIAAQAGDALDEALGAARRRGTALVANILSSPDMLSTDAFAEEIGATRETVHSKRRRHQVLGLEGPKRGVRFPRWQLTSTGELLTGLPSLFDAFGEKPWAIYRFLLDKHPELDGRSGLEALRSGDVDKTIAAARSIGAGAFA